MAEATATVAIQVNGKLRTTLIIEADAKENDVLEAASQDENTAKYLENAEIIKVIYIPNRLLNIVVK